MKTEPTSQKMTRGIAVFSVLGLLTTVNDKYHDKGPFWIGVAIGALVTGTAVFLTVKV